MEYFGLMSTPIPVRQMHDDGYITVRYLNPDGTRFEDELPEHLLFAANPHPITAAWEYGLGSAPVVTSGEMIPTLSHLNDVDPRLFEELLTIIQSRPRDEQRLWADRLHTKIMRPVTSKSRQNHAPVYRTMMRTIPVVTALVRSDIALANTLISRTRDAVQSMDHECFSAVAFCLWVTSSGSEIKKMKYQRHIADIEFIQQNMEAVMLVRDSIKRLNTIDRAVITDLISGSAVLSTGSL